MIAEWLLRNVRVSKQTVAKAMDRIDTDADGYISLGELIAAVRRLI